MASPKPERFGRYELVSRIGHGGMAETWRARLMGAAGVTKSVLIKKVLPQYANDEAFIRMFISEARISATLSHGNIAQVFDFGEAGGEYFLAMEFVAGQPLDRIIKRAQRSGLPCLPVPLAVLIALEMCRGLHYAHTRSDGSGNPLGIVHRDISPDNVLIGYEGQVKIVDFGIAKARLQRGFNTEPGMVKGKYLFFSPEQARGEEVDAATDVWATGVVLYAMVCGRLPLDGAEYVVMKRLVEGQFPRPREVQPEISASLDAIIMKALAVNKGERFESAHAFGDALGGFLYSSAPRASSMSVSYLLRELFREEMTKEGLDTKVPPTFLEELSLWRAVPKPREPVAPAQPVAQQTLPTEPLVPPKPRPKRLPQESAPLQMKASWTPGQIKKAVGAGLLLCALTGVGLYWESRVGPEGVSPIQRVPVQGQATKATPPPPPQPVTPVAVPAVAQAEPEQAPPPVEEPPYASAKWPVEVIRLDARRDVLWVNSGLVASTDLDPKATYKLWEDKGPIRGALVTRKPNEKFVASKPEKRGTLPLVFLVQGSAVAAQDASGLVSRSPTFIRGGSSLLLFTFGLRVDDENFYPRGVIVQDVATQKIKRITVHTEWMTTATDKAFLLEGLDPGTAYRLTLAPMGGEGALTRGLQNGPVRAAACFQDVSREAPTPGKKPVLAGRSQRFLIEEGQSLRMTGVGALRCGFIDDDPSDNSGEAELFIEQTTGGAEGSAPVQIIRLSGQRGRYTSPASSTSSWPSSSSSRASTTHSYDDDDVGYPSFISDESRTRQGQRSVELGRAFMNDSKYAEAATVARNCIKVASTNEECQLLLGDASAKLGRPSDALKAYGAFLRLASPDHPRRDEVRRKIETREF